VRQLDGPLNEVSGQGPAANLEMQIDFREHLGIGFGTLCLDLDVTPANVLVTFTQNKYDIVGCATTGAQQNHFHGAWRQVPTTAFWRTIHIHQMTAAGLGNKTHAWRTVPFNDAFHRQLLLLQRNKNNFFLKKPESLLYKQELLTYQSPKKHRNQLIQIRKIKWLKKQQRNPCFLALQHRFQYIQRVGRPTV
jgi:hypothetical protein